MNQEIPTSEHQAYPHVEGDQATISKDKVDIEEYFSDFSFESDSSARTGGSSIDPKSSTSKISADAGIPAHLLKGLDATTPEDALEKLIASQSSNSNTEGTSASSEQTVKSQV
ncbi:hypothetical protein A2U01_0059494, partial [Trifolium medium]|nr:hypothetical protein [Trifolium medium]